ncbi:hypothetical protein [Streptomyces sp. NPDC018031]|uniref:hypothetical protein n=1 Tax=Streptomyces sp. NPDC018031 TaxID=3365033 RepID=UPI00379D9582
MALTMTRRRWQGAGALAVAAASVAGALVWLSGSDDRALDEACAGVLPVAEVRKVLGDGEVEVVDGGEDGSGAQGSFGDPEGNELSVRCTVTAAGTGRVAVTIRGVPRPQREHGVDTLYTDSLYQDVLPAPVGHGWSGTFRSPSLRPGDDDGKATTTLALDCAKGRGGLLVTVETELTDATVDDPAARPAFVRVATATAAGADGHWGCGARLGDPAPSVGLPVGPDEYEPLLDAEGTCRGVPPGARRLGISTARETDRDRGLHEVCALGTRDGSPRFKAHAFYGPFAEEARARYTRDYDYENVTPADKPAGRLGKSGYWTSADCPGGGEPALYMIELDGKDRQTRPLDLEYERTALRAFAERSAKARGCAVPVVPAG